MQWMANDEWCLLQLSSYCLLQLILTNKGRHLRFTACMIGYWWKLSDREHIGPSTFLQFTLKSVVFMEKEKPHMGAALSFTALGTICCDRIIKRRE